MRRLTAVAATFITASTLVLGGAPAASAAEGSLLFLHGNGTVTEVADPPAGCYERPADSHFINNLTDSDVELRYAPCGTGGDSYAVYPDGASHILPDVQSYQVNS